MRATRHRGWEKIRVRNPMLAPVCSSPFLPAPGDLVKTSRIPEKPGLEPGCQAFRLHPESMKFTPKLKHISAAAGLVLVAVRFAAPAHTQTFSLVNDGTANASTGENYYTAADGNAAGGSGGTYTASSSQYEDGGTAGNGSLVIASGNLTIQDTNYGTIVGQSGGTGTLDVQGGTFSLSLIRVQTTGLILTKWILGTTVEPRS
jgi:hypothetical protein